MEELFDKKICKNCSTPFYTTKDTCKAEYCIPCKVSVYHQFRKTSECDEKAIYQELKENEGQKLWVDLENFMKNKF